MISLLSSRSIGPDADKGPPKRTPGASAGAVGAVLVALAFWMLRWSRRRHYLYHNKELVEIVPPLEYRKRNVDVETASVDSFEGVSF